MGRMLSSSRRPEARRQDAQSRTPFSVATPVSPADPILNVRPAQPPRQYLTDPFRKAAFYSSLALLFVRFAVLPEVIYYVTGVNTYLLYLVAPLAILGALMAGGVKRTFRHPAPYLWVAFFAWMILSTPFSSWQGGSFERIAGYGRVDFLFLIVVGGLAVNWKEVRLLLYTIAGATLFNLLTAQLFMITDNDRLSLRASGTIGNSNDLAAHLLLGLPFLLFITMDSKRNRLLRVVILGAIGYGLWVILGTASRGALVAIVAVVVFFLWYASLRQRVGVLLCGALLGAIYAVALPHATTTRLTTLFGQEQQEAAESATMRAYLFKKSVQFTMEHPLFGVGADQFSNYEGKTSQTKGEHGMWHVTHCTWTQVSSECGIPALIFYVGGLVSALLLVARTFRAARSEGQTDIANACFCYLLAMTGFLVAATFLATAYAYYFPAMIGLAVAMSFAARQQMAGTGAVVNMVAAG